MNEHATSSVAIDMDMDIDVTTRRDDMGSTYYIRHTTVRNTLELRKKER
jgi:hypothetical protein